MREMNAQEIVRWLNELEKRCSRLRWTAGIAVLVAIAALVIPALPERLSPWSRDHVRVFEIQSPDRVHTGRFVMGVRDGHDPSAVLTSTNRESHASLEIDKGVPTLDLYDEAGSRIELRLAPDLGWAKDDGAQAPVPGESFYGLSMKEPADAGEYLARLGGDQQLLALDLMSPTHGSVRLWSGRMDVSDPTDRDEALQAAVREPGAALVFVDSNGNRRVSLAMLRQPEPEDGDTEAQIPAEEPIPELALYDETGLARAVLRLDPVLRRTREDGSVKMTDPVFAPSFVLRDHLGRSRIEMKLDAAGEPKIRLLDGRGNILWSAP